MSGCRSVHGEPPRFSACIGAMNDIGRISPSPHAPREKGEIEEFDAARWQGFIKLSILPIKTLGNIEHPTSNTQHPKMAQLETIGCSMLDVGCWMFSLGWRGTGRGGPFSFGRFPSPLDPLPTRSSGG